MRNKKEFDQWLLEHNFELIAFLPQQSIVQLNKRDKNFDSLNGIEHYKHKDIEDFNILFMRDKKQQKFVFFIDEDANSTPVLNVFEARQTIMSNIIETQRELVEQLRKCF